MADLMDKLVNYAGEVSIYRSRLEQQMGSVRLNLKDVDATINRLKEQLRKMDMESEAQMTSRYQSASTKGSTEFDPLELDRFSNMQQLSRALSESVSDLLNLHEMLEETVRQISVPLVVRLGSANLHLSELVNLQPGDVVILEQRVSDPLWAEVAGTPKLRAAPSRALCSRPRRRSTRRRK